MAMHREFGDWYRAASVAPQAELLELRWSGVEAATEGLTTSLVIELVRLFVLRPTAGYVAPPYFDKAFRDHDTAFPAKGNIEELRVLAGAVLRNALEAERVTASAIAYGLVSAAFGSRHANLPNRDHFAAAQRFLTQRAASIRDSKSSLTGTSSITRERLDELLPANLFAAPQQLPNLRDPLLAALLELSVTAAKAPNANVAGLARIVETQREELNLLWWLQNAFSKDLGVSFTNLSASAAASVLALELADLTIFVPGPSAILGMIVTALKQIPGGDAKVSIKDAVNSTPKEWRQVRVGQNSTQPVLNLAPMHLAMAKSLETDGTDDWLPAFKKQAELNADDAFDARDIAHQVYCERMFVRALSELKK